MVGQTLGPYHVLAKLGEGEMGEVYRARDTRLDRAVAVNGAALVDCVRGQPGFDALLRRMRLEHLSAYRPRAWRPGVVGRQE